MSSGEQRMRQKRKVYEARWVKMARNKRKKNIQRNGEKNKIIYESNSEKEPTILYNDMGVKVQIMIHFNLLFLCPFFL